MKNLIYQVALGTTSNLYDVCTESVRRYAEKYGITYIKQTEPILKIVPEGNHRSSRSHRLGFLPIFEKENALSYFGKYDSIAVIDADIFIRSTAPNIFEYFSGDFGAVPERDMPLTNRYKIKVKNYSREQYTSLAAEVDFDVNNLGFEFMNMGMMLMNKSILPYLKGQTPKEFISRPEFKQFVDGVGLWKWSTDQTLLNYWIRKEKMNIQRLDWKWNALYKGIEDKFLPEAHFVHFFLKDHLPNHGENVTDLLKAINEDPQRYTQRM